MTVKPLEAVKYLILQPSVKTLEQLEQTFGTATVTELVAIHVQKPLQTYY